MLKTKIKAGAITNLTDARYFAAWGVEWLGFNLEKGHPESIPAANIRAIREWVDGVKIIGETNLLQIESFLQQTESLGLDGVQFADFAATDAIIQLPAGILKIQETVLEDLSQLLELESRFSSRRELIDHFILDFGKNAIAWADLTGENRQQLADICRRFPVLLSMDISAADLREILKEVGPEGFQVKGGGEEKVGYKSFDDIDQLFEAIEAEQ